jgi:hypothetical protein
MYERKGYWSGTDKRNLSGAQGEDRIELALNRFDFNFDRSWLMGLRRIL